MKITRTAEKINLKHVLDISVDVHKEMLCFYFEVDGAKYSDECRNRTSVIERKLRSYNEIGMEHGRKTLRIICEPTGQYQNSLFRTARRLGFLTSYVNAEAVSKFRVVETNDSGKTDKKDPRVIATLGRLNKVIRFRLLDEEYLMLRKLHKIYDEIDVSIMRLRCRLSDLLVELFCDYSFKKDFLYSNSGSALIKKYGCNPHRIVKDGFDRFSRRMKTAVPRIRTKTLERLWNDAQSSVLNEMPACYIAKLEQHLFWLMEDFLRQKKRKEEIVTEMKEILARLREKDPDIPPSTPHVVSDKNMARFIAETGPLGDFNHWRKLMRYAGFNIRMRQSGKFHGQNKITKKGRPLLRKVLHQIALPLVKKKSLYGPVYHHKKESENRPGNMAMTIVSRQLLKKIYGWARSGKEFDEKRFFTCRTQYMKLSKAA